MNRSQAVLVSLCILSLLIMVGCGDKTTTASAERTETPASELNGLPANDKQTAESKDADQQTNKTETKSGSTENKRPSTSSPNGTRPQDSFGQPDLFGQVKSVSQNKIALAVAKMPERHPRPQNPLTGEKPAGEAAVKPVGRPAGQPPTLEMTGETRTITIPSGLKIMSGMRDDTDEISISSLKAGDTLQVWFKEGVSGDIVEMVRVMKAP